MKTRAIDRSKARGARIGGKTSFAERAGIAAFAAFTAGFALAVIVGARAASAEPPVAGAGATGAAAGGSGEVGAAGRVVHRFTPPVAAPIAASDLGAPRALERGVLLRPCDSPGSGCRNPQASTPQVVVPPIVPGSRPPSVP